MQFFDLIRVKLRQSASVDDFGLTSQIAKRAAHCRGQSEQSWRLLPVVQSFQGALTRGLNAKNGGRSKVHEDGSRNQRALLSVYANMIFNWVVSRMLWKFPGGALRASEGSFFSGS
ncbi:hypothetical protein, partial [Phaeovulum sp. NW3]|uniref:hypothetical protein n=1 Tax=Phaeovulum sp. NW3 TaxID=2934933 RepID=UPI0020228E4F